jgi:hypothetical protein
MAMVITWTNPNPIGSQRIALTYNGGGYSYASKY